MIPLGNVKTAETCFELETAVLASLCDAFNTPHSKQIRSYLENGDWLGIKNSEPDPSLYYTERNFQISVSDPQYGCVMTQIESDAMSFKRDRLLSRILIKSDIIPTGIDTEEVAMDLFKQIETINYLRANLPHLNACWLHDFSRELNDLLAPEGLSEWTSPQTFTTLIEYGRNGNGSSAGMRNALSIPSDKYRESSSVSPTLSSVALQIKGEAWVSENPHNLICDTVKVSTVPKTAFVDRTVSANPLLDMRMQLSLGSALQAILKMDGIDIQDQTRNQNLAQRAFDLKLATIDLSSASSWFTERNTRGLVPNDLLDLIDLLRPKFWEDGSHCADTGYILTDAEKQFFAERGHSLNWHVKQMHNICPMGCGYTFTFMTAYFWCLVKSIVPGTALSLCSVYGDDIIVPQKYAGELMSRLEYLGFEVNRRKSFVNGAFFESCGREYFCGYDVTPFYLRRSPEGDSNSVIPIGYNIKIANQLRLWSKDYDRGCDSIIKPLWNALRNKRGRARIIPMVPSLLGDVGLISTLEEALASTSKVSPKPIFNSDGMENVYKVKVMAMVPTDRCMVDPYAYLATLDRMALKSLDTPENSLDESRPGSLVSLINDSAVVIEITPSHHLYASLSQRRKPGELIKQLSWYKNVLRLAHIEFLNKNRLLKNQLQKRAQSETPRFTRGEEPIKGLFGLPVIKTVDTVWPDEGLFWQAT